MPELKFINIKCCDLNSIQKGFVLYMASPRKSDLAIEPKNAYQSRLISYGGPNPIAEGRVTLQLSSTVSSRRIL